MGTAHPLVDIRKITDAPRDYLASIGEIFAVFDARTQDSGNISYGVAVNGERFFVKTAGLIDDAKPLLSHAQRCELLRNALRVWESCRHPALARWLNTIESAQGPMLVYAWADGELLRKGHPKFRALPVAEIVAALNTIYDLHCQLARAGWVAVDFYDSSLMYDFAMRRICVMDLDSYHRGPFLNEMGRMFGSTRFMAPEEFEQGAAIDERTTVFAMGRTAAVLLSDATLERAPFRGNDAMFDVVMRACRSAREERFASLAEFFDAWRRACGDSQSQDAR
jgi:serine/threonine-protein kinase